MAPEDVPDELARTAVEGYYGHAVPDGGFAVLRGPWQEALAAVLPEHEQQVRAKVAEELRADAAAHRRLVARKPTEYDEARLARATCLDDAASRISRGEPAPAQTAAAHTPTAQERRDG